jgi:hypothetical protein
MSDKKFPIKKKNFLKESDFSFVANPDNKPLNGVRFVMKGKKDPQIYYIVDEGLQYVKIKWQGGGKLSRKFGRGRVMELFRRGDWIPYFGPITENEGSKDFDWIEKEGKDKIYIINKLKDYLGKTDLSFEVDYEYDYSTSEFGDVEYFAKIWFDTDDGEEYYVELIENSKGNFRYDVFKTEMDGQQYVIDGSKSPEKSADDFWKTVAFRILTLKNPNIKGKDFPQLDESEDFDWVEDVTPRMNATLLKPGQKFYDKWGDVIRVLEYLGRDDEGEICYEPPCTLLRFRKIKDPSGYRMIPGLPADDPQNTDMIMTPNDFDSHIESGKLKLVSRRSLRESDEFDWIKNIGSSKINKDNNYAIYLGKDLDFSGVNADDLGVHPKSKLRKLNKREMFINVFFNNLEEFGYDVETARTEFNFVKWVYLNGNNPPTSYNIPKMSLEYDDNFIEDPSWEGEYVVLHNPIDINHFVQSKVLGESIDDFNWTKSDDIDNIKLNNVYFDDVWGEYYYVYKITPSSEILLLQFYPNSPKLSVPVTIKVNLSRFLDFLNGGRLKLIGSLELKTSPTGIDKYHIKKLNESNDFDWIEDVPLTMNVCEAYHVLKPNDEIIIDEIDNWENSPYRWDSEDQIQTHQNVKAKVLALDECNNMDKTNESSDKTILVSIDKDGYYGFDEMWSSDFVGDLPAKCRNNNCMFLICNDNEQDYEIRLVEKNKKPITEVAGISFESREWAKIINDEILKNPNEKERLIIDGYDYPEAFKSFPIDYIVIDFYDKLTGYGQEHSGYDKDGNYVVLLYIQPKVISGTGGFNLKTVLNHEMKHAWDDYNRISKGLPSIDKTKENIELYNKDFILMLSDKNITGPIKEILKYYYYLSELEKTAYLENVYDGNSKYEKIVRSILSKDFDEFKERFDLDVNWHLINTAYDIPFLKKFESPKEFIDKSSKDLKRKASETIKKINKMRYVHKKN